MKTQWPLRRLEHCLRPDVCPVCRDRHGRAVLIDAVELPDGTVVPRQPEPAPCARCGQIPEQIIRVIPIVVV